MNRKTRALILAAGKSKRMKSDKSKILHKILGKTIIEHVVDALDIDEVDRIAIVVSDDNYREIQQVCGKRVDYIIQDKQLGTGHAVMVSADWLKKFSGNLIVYVGDAPFLDRKVTKNLLNNFDKGKNTATLLTAIYDNPPPYGRIVRDRNNKIIRIVEEKDATEEEKKIKEVSSSHYCFDKEKLFSALNQIDNDNAQNEYYLPDVIEILINNNEKIEAFVVDNPIVTFGINNRNDLSKGIKYLQQKIINYWLDNAVTIIDPDTTYIDATVKIEKDTIIHPFTYLSDFTQIGTQSEIGPFVRISGEKLASNSKVAWQNIKNIEQY